MYVYEKINFDSTSMRYVKLEKRFHTKDGSLDMRFNVNKRQVGLIPNGLELHNYHFSGSLFY